MGKYDAIVIGGGVVGASALHQLSLGGGKKNLLLEKKAGYGRGATGSWGSLVRMFHLSLATTTSAAKSVPFYMDFKKHVGEDFQWTRTGSLYFLKEKELPQFEAHFEQLRASGLEFELIRARDGKRRFQDFSWYEDDVAVYEPNAGVACPWGTTEAFLHAAEKLGATSQLNTEVTEVVSENGKVKAVRTADGQTHECELLVMASGIWTNSLLAKMGTTSKAFSKSIQLNRFCRHHGDVSHPFFIDKASQTFGHPSQNGSFIGGYLGGTPQNGDYSVDHVSLLDANTAKQKISQRIPWVKNATLEGGIKALEAYTDTNVGIVERSSDFNNLIVTTGWSCAGFTLAPIAGQRVAKAALS